MQYHWRNVRIIKTKKKLRLIAHTHPDYDEIIPSKDDRLFLKQIGQDESIIISYITGKAQTFRANLFDNL